jgi:glycosyltransferase involved in cell wall biosynthesis
VKIAIYDKYWSTAGGGEKFAGGVAQVLADDHDVALITHEAVDTEWLGERLLLDLSNVAVKQIGEAGRLERASAAYDLLINLSFSSSDRNGAPHGIYVVHFPHDPWTVLPPRQQALLKRFGPYLGAKHPSYVVREGFYAADMLRASKVWWSDGDGEIIVPLKPRRKATVRLFFGALLAEGVEIDATIEVDGRVEDHLQVGPPRSKKDILLPRSVAVPAIGHADGTPVQVRVRSDTWSPSDVLGTDDARQLGVPLVGVAVGNNPLAFGRALASVLESYPPSVAFLDSYDRILANSRFTAHWIDEYWGRTSDLLYPPVSLRTPSTDALAGPAGEPIAGKAPMILSVGRFFAANRGHSKKQIEMVRSFRRLLARPELRSASAAGAWELHLVGGCSDADRSYLDDVRGEADGVPVVLHVDATGDEVDRLYRQASIYWHAAGYGEDEAVHPDRMEHFGITTVEAMSAGAVPVAFGVAGPLEAFDHGVEGFHFSTLDQLVSSTVTLLTDVPLRARMSRAAIAKAESFGMPAFAEHVHRNVDEVTAKPPRRR